MTNLPLRFVATGATVTGERPIRALNGAALDIRGIAAAATSVGVSCTSSGTASSITLRDSVITAGSGTASIMSIEKCEVKMFGGELDIGASTGHTVLLLAESAFVADRVYIHGKTEARVGAALATRMRTYITNSVLENVAFQWQTNDQGFPGSSVSMGFNTMVLKSHQLNCKTNSGSATRSSTYENNIIVSTNLTSAVEGNDCTLSHNVLLPYPGPAGTNIIADPQFADAASGDYRLLPTSPAVDVASPTSQLPATTDYVGTSRPQGATPDIGAFEYRPN
jgi:hypothetical protein